MSREIERLTRSCELGDRDAAERLWELARRHDDVERALLAATTADDPERLTIIAVDAWRTKRYALLERAADAIGVTLDAKSRAAVENILKLANGRRRKYKLGLTGVMEAIAQARRATHGLGVVHGGLDSWSSSTARSTFCVAIYDPKRHRVTVACGETWAVEKATPGRVWDGLKPWQRDLSRNRERALAWAAKKQKHEDDRVHLAATGSAPEPIAPRKRGVSKAQRQRQERLEGLLADEPSPTAFQGLLALLDRWPKGEVEAVGARVAGVLETWPDDTRALNNRWIEGVAQRDEPRPWDTLARALVVELGALSENRKLFEYQSILEGTFHHPSAAKLNHIELHSPGWSRLRPPVSVLGAPLQLRTLIMRFMAWSDGEAMHALLDADIHFADTLTRLELTEGGDRDGLGLHLDFAARFPGLVHLDISNSRFITFERFVSTIAGLPDLRVLGLRGLDLREPVIASLAEARPELESLDFRYCRSTGFYGALKKFPALRELRFKNGGISSRAIKALTQIPNLETLEISDCAALTARLLEALSAAPRLRHLNLDGCKIRPDAARVLACAPGFSQLETVSLAGNALTAAARTTLANSDTLRARILGVPNLSTRGWKSLSGG